MKENIYELISQYDSITTPHAKVLPTFSNEREREREREREIERKRENLSEIDFGMSPT